MIFRKLRFELPQKRLAIDSFSCYVKGLCCHKALWVYRVFSCIFFAFKYLALSVHDADTSKKALLTHELYKDLFPIITAGSIPLQYEYQEDNYPSIMFTSVIQLVECFISYLTLAFNIRFWMVLEPEKKNRKAPRTQELYTML